MTHDPKVQELIDAIDKFIDDIDKHDCNDTSWTNVMEARAALEPEPQLGGGSVDRFQKALAALAKGGV